MGSVIQNYQIISFIDVEQLAWMDCSSLSYIFISYSQIFVRKHVAHQTIIVLSFLNTNEETIFYYLVDNKYREFGLNHLHMQRHIYIIMTQT